MDIWEQGKLAAGDSTCKTHVVSKKYGEDAWKDYLLNHELYLAGLNSNLKNLICPLTPFQNKDFNTYKTYKKRGYRKSYKKYQKDCDTVFSTLKNFNYTFFLIRNNSLFKLKEFIQLCVLIKEIYKHGAFNYPTSRIEMTNNKMFTKSHPGQHLHFSRIFLGLENKVSIST